jgi:ADP-ribosylglycohydrolase
MTLSHEERVLGGLWGVLVGDALGVPVEFNDRSVCDGDPVEDMRAHGTHDQPAGTGSDDGAMTLCSVESLLEGLSSRRIADLFLRWYDQAHWSARGRVFDIGIATRSALNRIAAGIDPERAGGRTVQDNGNGALMRILPIALRFADQPPEKIFSLCEQASQITHGHIRSALACGIYCTMAVELLKGHAPDAAYATTRALCAPLIGSAPETERAVFARFLNGGLRTSSRMSIDSTGYVVDSLEASVWSLLQGGTFSDITLRAVNMGNDTDTTGAITGGLAGVALGISAIPSTWRDALPRQSDLSELFSRFLKVCPSATDAHRDPQP